MQRFTPGIFLGVFLLVFAAAAHGADLKIGFIDSERIFAGYQGTDEAKAEFQADIDKWSGELDVRRQDLEKLNEEFQSQSLILSEAKRQDGQYAVGEFIPTSKNIIAKDCFGDAGFRPAEVSERGSMWILDLASYTAPTFPWMRINATADVGTQSRTMTTAEREP